MQMNVHCLQTKYVVGAVQCHCHLLLPTQHNQCHHWGDLADKDLVFLIGNSKHIVTHHESSVRYSVGKVFLIK